MSGNEPGAVAIEQVEQRAEATAGRVKRWLVFWSVLGVAGTLVTVGAVGNASLNSKADAAKTEAKFSAVTGQVAELHEGFNMLKSDRSEFVGRLDRIEKKIDQLTLKLIATPRR